MARMSSQRSASGAYWVAGVDGCRGGWVVASAGFVDDASVPDQIRFDLCASFATVLALTPAPLTLAVDMPIGLLECAQPGGRACDRAARARLGRPRASSVFSPPARAALACTDYADAMRRNGAGLSKQAYNLLPRIGELDAAITPELQRRVFEAHPELAFARLCGRPLAAAKRTPAGGRARLQLLRRIWGRVVPDPARVRIGLGRSRVAADDVLDACVLAEVAWRIRAGQATRLPPQPQSDARGLRMEIWF
jgi:predicted RNase H-like nuclease